MEIPSQISPYNPIERRPTWSRPQAAKIDRSHKKRPARAETRRKAALRRALRMLPDEPWLPKIGVMPPTRVIRELSRNQSVKDLISLLGVSNAPEIADQALSAWFSEFREGSELAKTEAVMVLLYALTERSLDLGDELRSALSTTRRAEFVRLKRFAKSIR